MRVFFAALLLISLSNLASYAQTITWKNQVYEAKNVKASLTKLNGEEVLRVERDLKAFPFDEKNLINTVDEPTYLKLKNVDLENGTIELKMLSKILNPSPMKGALGFIGLAYRVDGNDKAYESIYLRPGAGRADSQKTRNHTVQYYSYPDYKFDKLKDRKSVV